MSKNFKNTDYEESITNKDMHIRDVFFSTLSLYHNVVRYSKSTGTFVSLKFHDSDFNRMHVSVLLHQDQYDHLHVGFICDLLLPKKYEKTFDEVKRLEKDLAPRLQKLNEIIDLGTIETSIEIIQTDIAHDLYKCFQSDYIKIMNDPINRISEDLFTLSSVVDQGIFLDRFISTVVFSLMCEKCEEELCSVKH